MKMPASTTCAAPSAPPDRKQPVQRDLRRLLRRARLSHGEYGYTAAALVLGIVMGRWSSRASLPRLSRSGSLLHSSSGRFPRSFGVDDRVPRLAVLFVWGRRWISASGGVAPPRRAALSWRLRHLPASSSSRLAGHIPAGSQPLNSRSTRVHASSNRSGRCQRHPYASPPSCCFGIGQVSSSITIRAPDGRAR